MNAYNEIDGVVCAADRDLLTSTLRDEWGFDGCVVSDYFSIRQLTEYHRLAPTAEDAAALALNAGLDLELPATDCFGEPLLDALEAGLVAEPTLDDAVRRVLGAKFALGLFDDPYVDTAGAAREAATQTHRRLAHRIAHKSIVLLKNDGILPLAPEAASVAVIGPNADAARHLFGDYCYPAHVESLREVLRSGRSELSPTLDDLTAIEPVELGAPSVLDALCARLGDRVAFAPGCAVLDTDRAGFEEAVALAAASDVAVLVMGDKAGLTDDCTTGEFRDRTSFDLPGVQEDLVHAVLETGTPVVLVLVAGRPAASAPLHEAAAAVVLAWFPGEEGAEAIADVLLGEVSPGGKLPISYPRSTGQVPVFYGHKISGGRSHPTGDYVDSPAGPLYPFGHGLSYTTFALSDTTVRQEVVAWDESFTAEVTVTNTGDRAGDEVVQLYVRDPQASVTRPVLELKSFLRVELEPDESKRVTFEVPAAQLGFYDRSVSFVVEPGQIDVFVGTSSAELVAAGSVTIVEGASGQPPEKAFVGIVSAR
jgi:beta-glucosidase